MIFDRPKKQKSEREKGDASRRRRISVYAALSLGTIKRVSYKPQGC